MRYVTVICDSCKDLIHEDHEDNGLIVEYNPHGMFAKPRELNFHKTCADKMEKTGYQDTMIESNGWIEIKATK